MYFYVSVHEQDIYGYEQYEMITTRNDKRTYEILFIVWISDKYRCENEDFIGSWDINMPYITEKTAYLIIDLIRINHPSIYLSKSFFS